MVAGFLATHTDASVVTIEAAWGQATDCGRQIFPSANGGDGFYYARLQKIADIMQDNHENSDSWSGSGWGYRWLKI